MATILRLPDDILEDLSSWLDAPELKAIRLTCSRIGRSLETHVFRSISIELVSPNIEWNIEKVKVLARGHPLIARGTRKLRVGYLDTSNLAAGYDVTEADVQEIFETIIPSLACLTSIAIEMTGMSAVKWMSKALHAAFSIKGLTGLRLWLTSPMIQALPEVLPSLRSLEVNFMFDDITSGQEEPLVAAQHVARLIQASPRLSTLAVRRPTCKSPEFPPPGPQLLTGVSTTEPLPLRHLTVIKIAFPITALNISHFRNLVSLTLRCPHKPFQVTYDQESYYRPSTAIVRQSETWSVFLEEGIRLVEIDIDYPCKAFYTYLASYSGVETLKMSYMDDDNEASRTEAANIFFAHSLPRHYLTLIEFEVVPSYAGDWSASPTSPLLHGILQCPNLRRLSIEMTILSRESEKTGLKEVLNSLCQTLPRLTLLKLTDGTDAMLRGLTCVFGYNFAANRQALLRDIQSYIIPPDSASPPVLFVGRVKFTATQVDSYLRYVTTDVIS